MCSSDLCGMAWGIQLDGKRNVVVTTVGDAATRQGDFFEAVCFAKEKKLPVLFVVEDNAYGISSPTREINPLALGVLEPNEWQEMAGEDVQGIYDRAADALEKMRAGGGPHFWWVTMERLSSHTSSDDQRLYRSADELAEIEKLILRHRHHRRQQNADLGKIDRWQGPGAHIVIVHRGA